MGVCEGIDAPMATHAISNSRVKLVIFDTPFDQVTRKIADDAEAMWLRQKRVGEIIHGAKTRPKNADQGPWYELIA